MGETHDENAQAPGGTETEAGAGEGSAGVRPPAEEAGASGTAPVPLEAEAGATGVSAAELPPVPEAGASAAAPVPPEAGTGAAGDRAAGAEDAAAAAAAAAAAEAAAEKVRRTEEVVAGLLERLGVEADIEVRDEPEAIVCNLRVRTGGDLFAAGPRGQVLEAAQYLVNKLVNRDADARKWINLELGGSRPAEPDPAVERMALRLGEAARRMGKTLTVVPMQAKDRRRVHVALAAVEGVETRSEGDGLFRRLLVEPKR